MQKRDNVRIDTLLRTSASPVAVCVSFLLSWIAVSDGPPTSREQDALLRFSAPGLNTADLALLLDEAGRGDAGTVLLACATLKTSLDPTARERIMEMLTAMALADGQMSPPARYILEFLADHFELGHCLPVIHRSLTGKPIPPSADPFFPREDGRPEDRPRPARQPGGLDRWGRLPVSAADGDIQDRRHAMSILGLPDDSNHEAVKVAFRRLAREHHPDHRRPAGPDAQSGTSEQYGPFQAGLRFIWVKKAYEYLRHDQRLVQTSRR